MAEPKWQNGYGCSTLGPSWSRTLHKCLWIHDLQVRGLKRLGCYAAKKCSTRGESGLICDNSCVPDLLFSLEALTPARCKTTKIRQNEHSSGDKARKRRIDRGFFSMNLYRHIFHPHSEGMGKVLFSQVSVCPHCGGRGYLPSS